MNEPWPPGGAGWVTPDQIRYMRGLVARGDELLLKSMTIHTSLSEAMSKVRQLDEWADILIRHIDGYPVELQ